MIVLGIETATAMIGVSLGDEEEIVSSYSLRCGPQHAEHLHVGITSLLESAAMNISDLDAIAVDKGPGRFIGLRVGIAAAKGLSFSGHLPLVGVTSTSVLKAAAGDRRAVAVVDLGRGLVAFEGPEDDSPIAGTLDDLLLRVSDEENVVLVGDGAKRHEKALLNVRSDLEIDEDLLAPPSDVLVKIGASEMRAGKSSDAAALSALYLAEANVRIGWKTRDSLGPTPAQSVSP